jgi:hypothetical protein
MRYTYLYFRLEVVLQWVLLIYCTPVENGS